MFAKFAVSLKNKGLRRSPAKEARTIVGADRTAMEVATRGLG